MYTGNTHGLNGGLFRKQKLQLNPELPVCTIFRGFNIIIGMNLRIHRELTPMHNLSHSAAYENGPLLASTISAWVGFLSPEAAVAVPWPASADVSPALARMSSSPVSMYRREMSPFHLKNHWCRSFRPGRECRQAVR